jgi:hypothetical protein
MSYARTVRVNPDAAGRDTANISRHMMCYAVFTGQSDYSSPIAYFQSEQAASDYVAQSSNQIALPFRVTRKQWDLLFSAGRIAWAERTASL